MEITRRCIPVTLSGVRSSHPAIPSPHPWYSCRSSTVWFLTYWRSLVSLNSFSLSEIIWPIIFFPLSFFYFYISIFFLRLCWGVKTFSEYFHFMSELLSSQKINIFMVTEIYCPLINTNWQISGNLKTTINLQHIVKFPSTFLYKIMERQNKCIQNSFTCKIQ